MSTTIYESVSGPWKQRGRTVEVFRSGLVRVEQDYMCKTDLVDAQTPAIDSVLESAGTPAIDGIYVYPEPQRSDNGDGFSTLRVTGYGRVRTEQQYQFERRLTQGTYNVTFTQDGAFVSSSNIAYTATQFVVRYVVSTNTTDIIPDLSQLENQFTFYDGDGNEVNLYRIDAPTGKKLNSIRIERARTISALDSNYFGKWQEMTAVVDVTISATVDLVDDE